MKTIKKSFIGITNRPSKDFRPLYHFVIPDSKKGPFDPSGNLYWKGRHHLFYIFTIPDDRFPTKRANIHGHASSSDLVNWTQHPWALVPEPEGPDSAGRCWSGDGFLWDGTPAIAYISNNGQTCLATSEDDLLVSWKKHPGNPVIPSEPIEGQTQEGDHAPYVWNENDTWYCIRGGYLPDEGDTVFLFKSTDLVHWKYLHPLYHPERQWTEVYEDMACPELFKLSDKYVLIGLSHAHGVHYYTGRWENERFIPEHHGRMNWPGGRFGAPESHVDDKGRRILWTWAVQGGPSPWKEVLSIPRVLTLAEDGKSLNMRPVEELEKLRGKGFRKKSIYLPVDEGISFDEIRGDSMEIQAEIDLDNASAIELQVLRSSDGVECTTIQVDLKHQKLSIDVSRSSLKIPNLYRMFCHFNDNVRKIFTENPIVLAQEAPFELVSGENLRLQVFIDRCMVEVFANGRQALCMQVFPDKEDSMYVRFMAKSGNARIIKLQVWTMREITLETVNT